MNSSPIGQTARALGASVLCAAALILIAGPANAKITLTDDVGDKQIKILLFGWSQLELRGGEGSASEGNGPYFRAGFIRFGIDYMHEPITGKLLVDFNQSNTNYEAGMFRMVKDAFVNYKWSNAAFIRLGMIKTPLGMNYDIPGWNLDIIERGQLEKSLVLERDVGLMLSGRLIGQERYDGKIQMEATGLEMGQELLGYGFGYDIGVFGPAGRSAAVIWDETQVGDAMAYVGRLSYDHGPYFHSEISYGLSEEAGGTGTGDYEVMDVGLGTMWYDQGLEFRAEYIHGSSIRGIAGWNQESVSLMAGWYVTNTIEGVVKHYQASAEKGGVKNTLGNTYVGLNIYLAPLSTKFRDHQRHKIVINYIFSSGDEEWVGLGGYQSDAWGVQWQYKF